MTESTAPARHAQAPGFYRFRLGAFEVIALHEGVLSRDLPAGFVTNASDAEVGEAYAAAGMPGDKLTITFTAFAVDTGDGIVLIDTGIGAGGPPGTGLLLGHLTAAGITPDDVSAVIISHFHGDHIGGLVGKDGVPVFPNATLLVPAPEWAFWMDDAEMARAPAALKGNFDLSRRMFAPYGDRITQFAWGEQFLPGFTSVDAGGHTPGMSAIEITSDGERLLFVADITNNPLVFIRHPEWRAMFDMDPTRTIATRRRLLDRAVAEKLRLAFYHAPFPALAHIARNGDGYEYLPALWVS